MEKYTNYCTPEQTKRAYKLGASIEYNDIFNHGGNVLYIQEINAYYDIPTTQQMIGWLRENGLSCQVFSKYGKFCSEVIDLTEDEKELICINEDEIVGAYKQAELAAIDAALDYLEKGETK